MKRISLSILFILFLVSAHAQFHVGLRGGLSSSQVEINESVEGISITTGDKTYGYHLGIFAQILIDNKIVIMPEVLFTSKGGKIDLSDGTSFKEVWNLKYNRIDMPLTVGVKFLKVFRLSAGPYASILLDANASYNNINENVKSNYRDLYWGYQAGIGLDIWKAVIDLKYEGSFQSSHKSDINVMGSNLNYSPDSRPNQWILSVGLRLF